MVTVHTTAMIEIRTTAHVEICPAAARNRKNLSAKMSSKPKAQILAILQSNLTKEGRRFTAARDSVVYFITVMHQAVPKRGVRKQLTRRIPHWATRCTCSGSP